MGGESRREGRRRDGEVVSGMVKEEEGWIG